MAGDYMAVRLQVSHNDVTIRLQGTTVVVALLTPPAKLPGRSAMTLLAAHPHTPLTCMNTVQLPSSWLMHTPLCIAESYDTLP
jgi:hypothetical protein